MGMKTNAWRYNCVNAASISHEAYDDIALFWRASTDVCIYEPIGRKLVHADDIIWEWKQMEVGLYNCVNMLLAYHMKHMMILHFEELLPMSAYTNPYEEN
jgi:hypothetical protein